jgi:hypothetical protein
VFLKRMLFALLYVRVRILFTCGKHLNNLLISLREEVWAHKTNLAHPLLIEVPELSQKSERS